MKLPNAGLARIDPPKLTRYLLDLTSPDGRGRALFFIARGFSLDAPHALKAALLRHPIDNEARLSARSPHGLKYEVRCHLQTPDGRNPCIMSVWIIEDGPGPRLVTAYPI